ncbi:Nonribosomal peptide synthetase [Trichinella pseudospiralis]
MYHWAEVIYTTDGRCPSVIRNETGKAISHQAVGSMGSEKGKRQEDELTDGLASIRSLFADHRRQYNCLPGRIGTTALFVAAGLSPRPWPILCLVDTDENDSINLIMHDNHQQYSHPDVSSTVMGFGIALAMPVQAPPRLTDAVYGNGWKIGSFWLIYFRPFHPERDLQFGRSISH